MLYAGRVDQEIWMYYDCSEAARVDARAVWSTRYDGVWHLEGDVVDSGPNAFPGHDVGSTKAAGVLAGGRHYDGRGGYTQLGENGALHDVSSVSLWVAFESFSDTLGDNVLLSIAGEDEVLAENYQLKFSVDADRRLYAFWEYANAKNVEDNFSSKAADIVSMVWYHLAVVRDVDAKTLEYYVNGERLGEIMGFEFGPEGGSSATIWLGAGQAGLVRNLHGFLDEVRVSRGLMTAPMIRADYLSSVGSIVSLGVPESRSMP